MKTFHSFLVLIFLTACSLPTETLTPTASVNLPITQSVLPTSTSIPASTITPEPSPTASATTTQTTEPTPTTKPSPTPEPVKPLSEIGLSHNPPETVQFIDKRVAYNMEVPPGKQEQAWEQAIDALIECPMLQDYWKDLLGEEPSLEHAKEYLRNSTGGPENAPYWLPAESPNGEVFGVVQGMPPIRGKFEDIDSVVAEGGLYLDTFGVGVFPLSVLEDGDREESIWLDNQLKKNYRPNGSVLTSTGEGGKIFSFWGITHYDHRLTFVMGNVDPAVFEAPWNDELQYMEFNQLGGKDGKFRPDVDPRILQARWDTYWEYFRIWTENKETRDWTARFICITPLPFCEPKIDVRNIEAILFEPVK